MIEVRSPRGPLLAVDPWVHIERAPKGQHLFVSIEGMAHGYDVPFFVPIRKADPAKILNFLRENIYPGSLPSVFTASLWVFGVTLVFFVAYRYLSGLAPRTSRPPWGSDPRPAPALTTRRGEADSRRWDRVVSEEVTMHFNRSRVFPLQIRRKHEAQSALVMGDIGSGKSMYQRGILPQALSRGDAVIAHDPHRELVEEFYREGIDWLLNPLDLRFPYWSPGEEIEADNEAEGLMMGQSLYPLSPGDQPFFIRQAAGLFAFLVSHYQPTGRQLGEWMANDSFIDQRVKGTEFERTLTKDSAGQRSGIIGTANLAGPAFRLLPDSAERRFSVKKWVQHRVGNIFVTNTLDSRAALRPLQSMWIDLLIARIISMGERKDLPFVWMILDELASLQHLPQLKVAVTENRKAGLSIVVGFPGKSQLEAIYGKDADTIFSQAKTKVILRTSESDAAEWASRLIGSVEIERVRESRPAHEFLSGGRGHNYSTEKREERLVMASEIQSLKDLHGYFRYEDIVCPVEFAVLSKTKIAEGYLPAPIRSRWNDPPLGTPHSAAPGAPEDNPAAKQSALGSTLGIAQPYGTEI